MGHQVDQGETAGWDTLSDVCLLDQKGTKSDILKAFKVVKEIAKKLKPLATPLPSDAAKLVKEEQNCRCPLCQRNCRPLGMGPLCKS